MEGAMTEPKTLNEIRLEDGRTLSYAVFGDPTGPPVFYFHGYPGSRLEPGVGHEAAAGAGVCLIAADRPGFGHSSPKPGRTILDWPDDVCELADALGHERFAAMGVSGGGPYAAACALRIPARLTEVAIVCGVGPFDVPAAKEGMMRANKILFGVARRSPLVLRVMMGFMQRSLRNPERTIQRMMKSLPEPDRAVMSRPEVIARFSAAAGEAFRQGTAAAVEEGRLYANPWGFRHAEVSRPVHLFQGELDVNVPPGMGLYQARELPDCNARFFPDEGHISLVLNRGEEIFATLLGKPALGA